VGSNANNANPAKSADGSANRSTNSSVVFAEDAKGNTVSTGSGFFVDTNVIATNYHLVKDADKISAKLVIQKRQIRITEIIGVDLERDLALLMVEGVKIRPLPFGDVSKLAIGDDIYVAGNPEGFEGTFSQGIISGFRGGRYIQITAPISHGSSGGPVLNNKGEVIGIAVGLIQQGQNLNFAIPASGLLSFKKSAMRIYRQRSGREPDLSGIEELLPENKIKWDVIAIDNDSVFLMDDNRFHRTDKATVEAWVKTIALKDKDKQKHSKQMVLDEYETLPHVLSLIEFDCKKAAMRTNFVVNYDERAKPRFPGTRGNEWQNISSNSIAHSWLVTACR
jgi:hypothetical protein